MKAIIIKEARLQELFDKTKAIVEGKLNSYALKSSESGQQALDNAWRVINFNLDVLLDEIEKTD